MSSTLNYRNELNPEQTRAVESIEGPLLIVAGAGSGKTRVITYRIANMLAQGIPQNAILALTFTNKAAREMQQRVRSLTGRKLRNLTVSTFHAFGVKLLRDHIHRVGYRHNFTIYDTQDQMALIRETAREVNFDLEHSSPWTLLSMFQKTRLSGDTSILGGATEGLYREYRAHLRSYNAVDFDDLILLPVQLMEEHPEVRAELHERYRYLLVDEFQDTSTEQYRFMQLLTGPKQNVCIVGDDDQSIYSWRGADFRNLRQFERDFPSLLEVKLERNYRSTDTILAAANGVIANNTDRKDKKLWTGRRNGKPIQLYMPDDERAEAAFVAERIKTLAMQDDVKYHEVGVLMRTNSLTRTVEEVLLSENIPYRVSGGESFFQRKEIRDIIGYLRVAANPDDDVSLLRIINTPRRGLGRRTLDQLTEIAHSSGRSLYSTVQAVVHAAESPIARRAREPLNDFAELIEEFRERFFSAEKLSAVVESLVDRIEYWGHLISEYPNNDRIAKWKFKNVGLFIDFIRNYENHPDNLNVGLYDYLNRITLQQRDDVEDDDGRGKVNVMTIHAAKGLEHRVVFLIGAEDGILPHARAIEEDPKNLEEERRLFYVALTRAQEWLYVTSCRTRTIMRELREAEPSPFLEEIPRDLVEHCEVETTVSDDEAMSYFQMMKEKFASK